jgi:GH15 family glucan-1,4-alpha-glucosidase
MPVGGDGAVPDQLIRRVRVVRGRLPFHLECRPAFDYACGAHECHLDEHGARFDGPGLSLGLSAPMPLRPDGDGVVADFALGEGETAAFALRRLARYDPADAPDGLPGREGTFNMCSFWLVEALTRAGRTYPARLEDARLLFEQMLGYANHLGLYAEQTGNSGEALGNYPQAFTHLALISAAFNLDRALGAR